MIDYIYTSVKGLSVKEFFENPALDFTSVVSLKTGEISPNIYRRKLRFTPYDLKEAEYKHFMFSIGNDTYINLQGSPHQSSEDGHNFSDFTYFQLFEIIKDLQLKFQINPYDNMLHNVEFSVNIVPHIPTKEILDSIISFHGQEYIRTNFKGEGDMIKFIRKQYEIKIYDKAMQKNLDEQLLRFEIKVTRMEFLQKKGIAIHSTADLLNPVIHKQLRKILLHYLQKLIIYDKSIDLTSIPEKDAALLKEGQNPRYWKDLQANQYETFKGRIKRFDELVCLHGKNHIKYTLYHLISDKWNFLTGIDKVERTQVRNFLATHLSSVQPKHKLLT